MGCNCGDGLHALAGKQDELHALLKRFLSEHASPSELYETTNHVPAVSTAPASGTITFDCGSPVTGKVWYVEWISKHCSAGTATLSVFIGPKGMTDTAYRRDFSPASADDIATENPAIYVGPGEYLTLQWAGATAAAILSASLQIRVHRLGQPFGARE